MKILFALLIFVTLPVSVGADPVVLDTDQPEVDTKVDVGVTDVEVVEGPAEPEPPKKSTSTYCGIEGQICRIDGRPGLCVAADCDTPPCKPTCMDEAEAKPIIASRELKEPTEPPKKKLGCATPASMPYSATSFVLGVLLLVGLRRRS